MKKKRVAFETFSLSFLDVVSCGFGAIVLLLVIIKIADPVLTESAAKEIQNNIVQLQSQTRELEKESSSLQTQLKQSTNKQDEIQQKTITLTKQHIELQDQLHRKAIEEDAQTAVIEQLSSARQSLNEELRRLQATTPPPAHDAPIGGVPVDSEYIIFIIDTSGSMQQFAWRGVRRKMAEILKIYPRVKGIQVMNDMGEYMFSRYAGKWIKDSPARRKAILKMLAGWMPFSNSSPVEGVTAAIKRFYATDKKISLYILGDDFSRGSIQEVVSTINTINRSQKDGSHRVRIHAVGFPVLFGQPGAELNVSRFAALMRRLAEDNDGSFVGLTRLQ